MMLIIDGSRKCLNIMNTEKASEDDKKCVGVETGYRLDRGVKRECAESTGCGFGIGIQL